MKVTVISKPEGRVVSFICSILGLTDKCSIENGEAFTIEDDSKSISSLKSVLEYLVSKNKQVGFLLGGNADDKKAVADALSLAETVATTHYNMKNLAAKLNMTLLNQSMVALPNAISLADYVLYFLIAPSIAGMKNMNGYLNTIRWFDYVQHLKEVRAANDAPELLSIDYSKIDIHAAAAPIFADTPKKEKVHKEEPKKEEAKNAEVANEDCISMMDIRVGRIVKAWNHPDSEKLYCEEVDIGEETTRQIGSGIRAFHTFEEMQGHRVCVFCNLKPRKLGGFPSNGMLLCACTEDHSAGALIEPPADAKVGERVTFPGFEGEPATPAQVQKKKYLEAVLPFLKTNAEGVCCYKDTPFTTSAGAVTCSKFPNQQIS